MASSSSKSLDVNELSKLVRSIIMSEKGGMEKDKFLSVYKSQEGSVFPFKVGRFVIELDAVREIESVLSSESFLM